MPTLREQHLLAFFYLPLAGGGSAVAAAPRPPNHVDVDATLAHTGRARGRPAQAVAAHASVTERGPPRDGIVAAHLRGIRSGRQGLPRKEKEDSRQSSRSGCRGRPPRCIWFSCCLRSSPLAPVRSPRAPCPISGHESSCPPPHLGRPPPRAQARRDSHPTAPVPPAYSGPVPPMRVPPGRGRPPAQLTKRGGAAAATGEQQAAPHALSLRFPRRPIQPRSRPYSEATLGAPVW